MDEELNKKYLPSEPITEIWLMEDTIAIVSFDLRIIIYSDFEILTNGVFSSMPQPQCLAELYRLIGKIITRITEEDNKIFICLEDVKLILPIGLSSSGDTVTISHIPTGRMFFAR